MIEVKTIMAFTPGRPGVTAAKEASQKLLPDDLIASVEVQADRLGKCEVCDSNPGGKCQACCGGVPVAGLVILKASRCKRKKWVR